MMPDRDSNKHSPARQRWTPPKLTRIDASDAEGGLIFGPDLLILGS
jgi:hypothetical protein